ncbi:MAG: SDR family NAD(P)-dependent oxidoreductase [bacterium]|nr:SDR family NAD(P)-dependent oxidoreductase [bacterium]
MSDQKKIFLPFAPSALSALTGLIEDGVVYYTCADAGGTAALEERLKEISGCAGGCVTAEMTLEAIAPAVVSCAENLGAIDRLVYAPELKTQGELFLDLTEEDFTAHTVAVNGLFTLCKCALPYMMGGESPEIIVKLPRERENLTAGMYRAAVKAVAESLNGELAPYGVNVKLV